VLRDCIVLAIEGTHASGKTTLTHALAAHYRERGIHVATVEEPARNSPFIEEIVVHGKGTFDLETEVDLLAAQLSAQLRAARQHTMIIADKTIANVMAYAWLVLQTPPGSREATSCRVASDNTTWPPCAAAAIRAARCTSSPTYPSPSYRSGSPECKPIRTRTATPPGQSWPDRARCAATQQRTTSPADSNTTKKLSPSVPSSCP
jgi:hypothetical protein